MKKLMILSFASAAILVACSKKTAPAGSGSGSSSSKDLSVSKDATSSKAEAEKSAATEKAATEAIKVAEKKPDQPVTGSTGPAVPNKPSEEDAGKLVYNAKCTTCHGAKTVSAYTFNQWEGILKSMVPKAKLSADEENQVVAYIKANAK
jgi:cytochrome c5